MSDQPKPNPQLDASRWAIAEQKRNTHFVTVESGLTKEQILHPDFWGHIATRFTPYDEITVACDDGSYLATLVVTGVERTFLRVRCLHWYDLTTTDVAKSQAAKHDPANDPLKAYEVKSMGPHLKWCVIRNSDAEKIREKEPSRKAAETWLDDYLRITA